MKNAGLLLTVLSLALLTLVSCIRQYDDFAGAQDVATDQQVADGKSGDARGGDAILDTVQPDVPRPKDSTDSDGTPDTKDTTEPLDVKETIDTTPEDTVPVDPAAPDILVDPLAYTFTYVPGVVNPATTSVQICNQGTGTLKITGIQWADGSSPEFTFMALPPLPATVHPYDHTAVTVVFNEKAPHGPADLVITSNDSDSSEVLVHFNSQPIAEDQPCIQIQPSSLNFGQVERGDTKVLGFSIINCSSSSELQIVQVERSTFFGMPLTNEFQLVPTFPTPSMVGANQSMPWQLSYSPGLAGPDNGYFLFYNNDASQPQAKLDVSGIGVPPPLEEIGLHVELEWDTDNCDVDLHLLAPGGTFFDCDLDCHFGNPSPDWGTQGDVIDDPFLDYDDIDGYGPENTNINEPQPGTYKILLHYYNDKYEGIGGGPTYAIVRVYSYGQLLDQFGPQNLDHTNRNWDVCLVDWPSANITPLGNTYMVSSSDVGSCMPF